MPAPDWRSYLVRFHAERAGITEAVLTRAVDGDVDPYRWVAEAVPAGGAVVDVACGSGPLATALGPRWVGLDLSSAELDVARGRAAGRLQRAHAGALPVADGSAAAVVCALALMLVEPAPVLAEIRRVLAPGARLVALLPAGRPLTERDRLRYARLEGSGLRVVTDERRRFRLRIDDEATADLFVRSLYVPGAHPRRVARATAVARRWVGSELGLPLRRVVAEP